MKHLAVHAEPVADCPCTKGPCGTAHTMFPTKGCKFHDPELTGIFHWNYACWALIAAMAVILTVTGDTASITVGTTTVRLPDGPDTNTSADRSLGILGFRRTSGFQPMKRRYAEPPSTTRYRATITLA